MPAWLWLPCPPPLVQAKLLERGHELHDVRDALDRLEAVGLQVGGRERQE